MLDIDYGVTPGYDSSLIPSPTVTPVQNAGAATAPSNPLLSPAPAMAAPSSQNFINDIQGTPEYKQAMQNIDLWAQQQKDNAAFEAEWNKKFYDQNRAQIAGSGSSSGAGLAQAEAIDRLQKEKAAHDLANQKEYTREALGSRGLGSSGQASLEQSELKYSYDMLIKQIDLAADARRAQAAQASANANRGIKNQLADLDLRYQYELAKQGQYNGQLASDIAQKKGSALLQVADQLRPYYFDSNGNYIGPNGQVLTPAQAQATIQPSGVSAVDNLYAASNVKNMGF